MDAIVKGSVAYVARATRQSIARVWTGVELIIILDVSSSMTEKDGTPLSRIRRAQIAVEKALERNPGKTAMILFGEKARLNIDGVLPDTANDGATRIAPGLQLFKEIAPPGAGVRGLIVTDGEVLDLADALEEARGCAPCDGLFIGDERNARAQSALRRICRATGGSSDIAIAQAPALELVVARLLDAPR